MTGEPGGLMASAVAGTFSGTPLAGESGTVPAADEPGGGDCARADCGALKGSDAKSSAAKGTTNRLFAGQASGMLCSLVVGGGNATRPGIMLSGGGFDIVQAQARALLGCFEHGPVYFEGQHGFAAMLRAPEHTVCARQEKTIRQPRIGTGRQHVTRGYAHAGHAIAVRHLDPESARGVEVGRAGIVDLVEDLFEVLAVDKDATFNGLVHQGLELLAIGVPLPIGAKYTVVIGALHGLEALDLGLVLAGFGVLDLGGEVRLALVGARFRLMLRIEAPGDGIRHDRGGQRVSGKNGQWGDEQR